VRIAHGAVHDSGYGCWEIDDWVVDIMRKYVSYMVPY
jgi:hypothetical protein